MLKFIFYTNVLDIRRNHLNTSHVEVYRIIFPRSSGSLENLNTSHVEVYLIHLRQIRSTPPQFKYISCWSLSSKDSAICTAVSLFKYISCWSLSWFSYIRLHSSITFKYISCWSLSRRWDLKQSSHSDLNTSHVEVYLLLRLQSPWESSYLNTSQVEVYHNQRSLTEKRSMI